MTVSQEPPKKSGGCLKAFGIGCLIVLILGGIGGFYGWKFVKGIMNATTTDAAKVEAAAAEMLPGAKAPPPYHGTLAMEILGYKIVAFGLNDSEKHRTASTAASPAASASPSEDEDASPTPAAASKTGSLDLDIFLLALPAGKTITADEAKEQLSKAVPNKGGSHKVVESGPEELTVRGKPVTFQRSIEESAKGRTLQYVGRVDGADSRTVFIMFMAPEKAFDKKAMGEFLSSIK